MLTISLSAKVLRITFARKDEAAGNSEPLSRAPGLQARRGAQDFRRGKSDAALRGNLNVFSKAVSSLRAESPNGIASLSSTAAGLLQSFITSFAGSVSHKSLPSARYRLAPMCLILPASSSPDLKAFPSSAGSYIRSDLYEIPLSFRRLLRPPSLPNLPRAGRAWSLSRSVPSCSAQLRICSQPTRPSGETV